MFGQKHHKWYSYRFPDDTNTGGWVSIEPNLRFHEIRENSMRILVSNIYAFIDVSEHQNVTATQLVHLPMWIQRGT